MKMSNEILNQNLEAMGKWYPDFAKAVKAVIDKNDYEALNINLEQSWDGSPIFSIIKDGRQLYLTGKRNTVHPLDVWMERLGKLPKEAPVFLIGLGSGLFLKRLCTKTDVDVRIVVYEPSLAIFIKAMEEIDFSREIEERLIAFIVEGINENELTPVVEKLISIGNAEFLKFEIHPNYNELFPEEVLEATKIIRKKAEMTFVSANTSVRFQNILAINQMVNMRYLIDGYNTVSLMKAIDYNDTAILVSAGPSLNKNIEMLKKAKNRAFILAVDTALKPLIKAGIRPDAFITIDGSKTFSLVELEEIKDIPIITPATANYAIIEKQRAKKIFYYDSHFLAFSVYMRVGKILPGVGCGGSVATSGMSLLFKMRFKTVILVGQDLAMTNNRTHADGTFEDVMPEIDTTKMVKVKGNFEELVPTSSDFKLYLDWFVDFIKGANEVAPFKVINATEGGAYIEGTEWMSLDKAIDKYCNKEINFEERINAMESEFTKEEKQKIVEFLHELPGDFVNIQKNAAELKKVYHKIEKMCKTDKLDETLYLKCLKKIKKLSKEIEKGEAFQLLQSTMALSDYIVKSESLYEGNNLKEDGRKISEQGKRYAKIIEDCARELGKVAKDVLTPLEVEMEEE